MDPSSYILRYPLLLVVIGLFARLMVSPSSRRFEVALGVALGTSLFLNTETGVYMAGAASISTLLLGERLARNVLALFRLGGLSLATFWGLSLVAFGPGVLDPEYLWRLFEPLIIYGGGFNAWPIEWSGGWHHVYNVIAPGVAVATIAWVTVRAHEDRASDRGRLSAILMLSLLGLAMSAKYANQSIVGVWHVNAYGFVAVMAWWARSSLQILQQQLFSGEVARRWFVAAARTVVLATALAGLLTAGDARNPSVYGLRAYALYPSLLNASFGVKGRPCPDLDCLGYRVRADVDLITERTDSTERVALIEGLDWTYLIEARRAPKFTFVPSQYLFTHDQVAESVAGIDLVFLPRNSGENFGILNLALREALVSEVREHFVLEAEGDNLAAWRRRISSAHQVFD